MTEASGSLGLKVESDSDNNRVDTTTGDGEPDVRYHIPSDNRHFRRYLEAALQKHGSQLPEEIMNYRYIDKCKRAEVAQYIDDFATKSEECVYEKMRDCSDFVLVTNWSELMHSEGMKETCNNELALAMKAIAATEQLPEPKHANGVDFKLLYRNLSNMMMGHPIMEMNGPTAKVLKDTYEETLSWITQVDNGENSALLRERLKNIIPPKPSTSESLCHENLDAYFTDSNLNPLQVPFNNLFYVSK